MMRVFDGKPAAGHARLRALTPGMSTLQPAIIAVRREIEAFCDFLQVNVKNQIISPF